MDRNKSLFNNTVLYALPSFIPKSLGLILLPFYTRFLSTSDYGHYDLIVTTTAILIPVISMLISDSAYRHLLDSLSDDDTDSVISNAFCVAWRNVAAFGVLYLVVGLFIHMEYGLTIFFLIAASVFFYLWQQIARGLKRNAVYSFSGILFSLVFVFFNIVFLYCYGLKVNALLLSSALSALVTIVYLESRLRLWRHVRLRFIQTSFQSHLLKYSYPLVFNSVSWWLISLSDRYLLNLFIGFEANGLYAVATKLPSICLLLSGIFYLSWQDVSIVEYSSADRNEYYSSVFDSFLTLQFTATLVLIASTKWILQYLVSPAFYDAWKYIPFLYLGAVFSSFSAFYGTVYLSSKNTRGMFLTTVAGSVLNILFNLLFLPIIGIQAASISTMLSFLLLWLLRVRNTRDRVTIRIDYPKLVFLAIMTAVGIALYFTASPWLSGGMFLLSTGMFLALNKKLFVYLWGTGLELVRR